MHTGFCHGSTRFCGGGGASTVSNKPQQDRSHGSEGCGALDQHQHGRPPAPDQETVASFQNSMRPSSPPRFCPPLSHLCDLVQSAGSGHEYLCCQSCLSASLFKRRHSPSPLRALVSRRHSNKHYHHCKSKNLTAPVAESGEIGEAGGVGFF